MAEAAKVMRGVYREPVNSKGLLCMILKEAVDDFLNGLKKDEIIHNAQWRDLLEFFFWADYGKKGFISAEEMIINAGLDPDTLRDHLEADIARMPEKYQDRFYEELGLMCERNKKTS